MAGNRKAYDDAMRMATRLEEAEDWPSASKAYRAALQEFPQDARAIIGIGKSYHALKQYSSAIRAFQMALKAQSTNYEAWGYLGASLEASERVDEAVKTYMYAANVCLKAQQADEAIANWERVIALQPTHIQARNNLAQIYIRQGEKEKGIEALVELAAIFQERQDREKTSQMLEAARRIDDDSRLVQMALAAFDNDLDIRAAQAEAKRTAKADTASKQDDAFWLFTDEPWDDEPELAGPGEQAHQLAQEELANVLFESDEAYASMDIAKSQVDLLITKALEAQTRSRFEEAIGTFEELRAHGFRNASLIFVLAWLYQHTGQHDKAIEFYSQIASEPAYKIGVNFMLGDCHRALSDMPRALQHFIETLSALDLEATPQSQQAGLRDLYKNLFVAVMQRRDSRRIGEFVDSLVRFLSEPDPVQRFQDAKSFLANGHGVSVDSLVEFLEAADPGEILYAMNTTQELLQQNQLMSAVESCFMAIQRSPFYLPLHMRLADVYMRQDRLEVGIEKYLMVAEVYQVREQMAQVSDIYQRVLKLAPMNTTVRSRLIELHLAENNIDGALEQYVSLAEACYQLAQIENALDNYREALRLSGKSGNVRSWQIKILHRMADIYDQRVDWPNAGATYEQILKRDPEDAQASLALVDLYFKLGRVPQATSMLDRAISLNLKQGNQDKILQFLRDQVQLRPDEFVFQERLGALHAKLGQQQEAIRVFDTLAGAQLDAGLRDDAARTLERILSLKPASPAAYQDMLTRIRQGI